MTTTSLGSGAILLALASRRRRRERTDDRVVLIDEGAIDTESMLLGIPDGVSDLLGAVARALAAARLLERTAHVVVAGGEASLEGSDWTYDPDAVQAPARCLVIVLGEDGDETHLLYVPAGSALSLAGAEAPALLADAVRVSGSLGLGHVTTADASDVLYALAVRDDDELVVCVDDPRHVDEHLARRCVVVGLDAAVPDASASGAEVRLADGRTLDRSSLAASVRTLLDGVHDRSIASEPAVATLHDDRTALGPVDGGAVVRLLTAVPRVDGLAVALESGRERRAVELVAYLALHAGEPVTGERLRVRVLGSASSDAASKTLFNVASTLRHALGDGPSGPRLPPAGRLGRYLVRDVACDVTMLAARVERASHCDDPEERMAWLRAALELIESEPFATVLAGYDWFLAEGHLSRLQVVCEDAACELIDLALDHGLVALAAHALDRARLVDPYAERLAAAAASIEAARQASFAAIAPAARSTVPSAPVAT